MCELNTSIRVDAKRFGISNYQLLELHRVFHEENGDYEPESLVDLLEVLT